VHDVITAKYGKDVCALILKSVDTKEIKQEKTAN
jgi:hypothetical protein